MTEVHLVNINMNQPNALAQLQFVDPLKAALAYQTLSAAIRDSANTPWIEIIDQYNTTFAARPADIMCICLIDKARSLDGEAEMAVMQGHANVKLQKRAASDPTLRQGIVPPGQNGILRPQ